MNNQPQAQTQNAPVLLYLPNLVGYFRIFCIVLSFFMFDQFMYTSLILYAFNVFLDFVDGPLARKHNQCSQFGKYLDVMTDKMGTLALTFVIAKHNFNWIVELLFLYHLNEIIGLWMYLVNAAKIGAHHKSINNKYTIINWFYQNKYYFLDYLIISAEMFHILTALYLRSDKTQIYVITGMILSLPGFLMKAFVASVRFVDCVKKIGEQDNKDTHQS